MIKVTISSWNLKNIAKEHPDDYLLLKAACPTMDPIEIAQKEHAYPNEFEGFMNDISDLPDSCLEKAEYKAVRTLKFLKADGRPCENGFKEALSTAQVHLPGHELVKFDEVSLEENCCTDELQAKLDLGWRIIAVCPAQSRRPDYVLGRKR